MTEKVYCPASGTTNYEVRTSNFNDRRLAKCDVCARVLRLTLKGVLHKHQPRGRTTASMDRTMDILWESATENAEANAHVPADFEGDIVRCATCGNLAPKRDFANAPDECSACFIGRTANQLVTRREAEALIAELQKMIAD